MASVQLTVNGQMRQLEINLRQSLLDVLRENLDLTGTKKGCDQGQCGACTVLVDGRRVVSCLTLAVMKDGASITTIEGLAQGWNPPSAAAGVHRSRCVPVRLLHTGPDLLGRGPHRRRQGQDRSRNSRADERQHLPVRCVHQHCRGNPAGDGAVMISFEYSRSSNVADAVRQMAASPAAKFVAGGTNLVDLMKMDVERPAKLIDISRLPLDKVEETAGGGLRIGALVRNSDLAYHPLVEQRFPVLSSAVLAGASQQLRNMASTGGNLLQRTRCPYFYDIATPCNKREPGSGCSAIDGLNRMNAILGTSDACIAVHPSDMCVALAVLEAKVHVTGPRGERVIAFADFHRLPADTPQRDTNLEADELVTVGRAACAGVCDQLHLSQDPRPALLCVRAGIRRGRARARGRRDQGGAFRARRRRAQALARPAGRGGAARPCRQPRRRSHRRPISCWAKPRASGTTRSRSISRAGPSSARCRRRRAARRSRSPTRRSREQTMAPYIGTATSRVDGHRQGHRRRKVCRRVQRARPRPWRASSARPSRRAASRASTRARPCASRACSPC